MITMWANLGLIILFTILTLLGGAVLYMLLAILEELILGRYRKNQKSDTSDTDGFYVF